MLSNLLQVPIFLLIMAAYFFVLRLVFGCPFFFLGVIISVVDRLRRDKVTPEFFGAITRAEVVAMTLLPLLFLFCFFWFRLWESSWVYIWQSPLLISVLYISSTLLATGRGSYNPIYRNLAESALIGMWPISGLLLLGFFAPHYIRPAVFLWAVTVSAALLCLIILAQRFRTASDVQDFAALDRRHDVVGESLGRLQHLSYLIGDVENWKAIREAVENVEELYSKTLQALRERRLQEADALMIRAEAEVSHVEKTFQDRIRLSLRHELKSRLEQASLDVNGLQEEFEVAGLKAGNLDELKQQIAEMSGALDALDMRDENLLERLAPFEKLFREIVDTRTALRFRQQVDAAALREEVEQGWLLVEVAKRLGLDTSDVEERRKDVEERLQRFQGDPIKNSGELVGAYQSVRKALSDFRVSLAFLESQVGHGWSVRALDSGRITAYVPKACSTDKAVQGAVGVAFDPQNRQDVSLSLDGTLLELEADRTINVAPLPGRAYGSALFTFAGKRGGQAILKLGLSNPREPQQVTFPVLVTPSVSEIARDALIFATPVGAVAVLLLWRFFGYELKDAAYVGAGVGGGFGLLVFALNYLRFRRMGRARG